MTYSITLDHTLEKIAPVKWRLDVWVTACDGFDDPGFFLLHAKKNLTNKEATPKFETFANPCTLVEYNYGKPERPHGMYRDRKASFMFSSDYRAKEFYNSLLERKDKLVSIMNTLATELESSPSVIVGDITIKKTSTDGCSFMRIRVDCSKGAPFVYKDVESNNRRFIGLDTGIDIPEGCDTLPYVDILTYTTRGKLVYQHLLEDAAERLNRG